MKLMRWSGALALAMALTAGTARPAAAQSITRTDIQRLQDSWFDVSRDVAQIRSRDGSTASWVRSCEARYDHGRRQFPVWRRTGRVSSGCRSSGCTRLCCTTLASPLAMCLSW